MSTFPNDWYWVAANGQAFASARKSIVNADDSGLAAFVAAGHSPTPWPKDGGGAQTTSSLQEVLTPYGIFADLAAYAASARYKKEVGGIVVSGATVQTDRGSQAQLTGAYNFVQANPSASIQWKQADGSFVELSAEQITAIALAVAGHVQGCFAKEAEVLAGINAEPATITTTAQIDAAFAA